MTELSTNPRRYDLDWSRFIAIVVPLFFSHRYAVQPVGVARKTFIYTFSLPDGVVALLPDAAVAFHFRPVLAWPWVNRTPRAICR